MGIADTTGEFNYSITSSTYERQTSGGVHVVINVEGPVTGYGVVNGTLTLVVPAPGAQGGPGSFTGASFLDSGEVVGLTGDGYWQQLDGEQKWRVRGINLSTNGQVSVSDGTIALAERSFSGTFNDWT